MARASRRLAAGDLAARIGRIGIHDDAGKLPHETLSSTDGNAGNWVPIIS